LKRWFVRIVVEEESFQACEKLSPSERVFLGRDLSYVSSPVRKSLQVREFVGK
jgi:hypothetical protein